MSRPHEIEPDGGWVDLDAIQSISAVSGTITFNREVCAGFKIMLACGNQVIYENSVPLPADIPGRSTHPFDKGDSVAYDAECSRLIEEHKASVRGFVLRRLIDSWRYTK